MRGSPARGCTPHAISVLAGAMTGALVLITSGRGLTPVGIGYLLAGYIAGAVVGYWLVVGLGRVFGEWWHE
jgi:hypothetical protein